MAAFLPLHSDRKSELRDPTLEELYTGPIRALPDEIQQLPDEDTACTFCGVSYFIFAEVQTLQTTVKQYKKAFRDFVQFLEHERSVAQNLRQQAIELKSGFAELVMTCSSTITQFSEQNKAHCSAKQEALEQVLRLQKELFESKTQCQDLHFLCQRNEASQNTHALTEQELRNEISQLTLQVMNCKAQIQSQQELFEEEHSRNQQRIRDFESKFVEWTTIERQNGAERDDLKQKLETMSQRVELEASQMELELAALRKERDQVVASRDSEREVSSVEISNLKNQLSSLDMMRLQLVSENGRYKDITLKLEDEIAALRLAADQMHGQLSVSTKYNENVKENLIRDLEKAREKYEKEIDSLQQGHAQAIEELKFCQNERMEIEKQKTVELASQREQTSREAFLAIENRLQDTERRANEWRDRALQNAREIEEMKRNGLDHETLNQTLQNQLDQSLRDKRLFVEEVNKQRLEVEQKLRRLENQSRQERDKLFQEAENRQQVIMNENTTLKERLDKMQHNLKCLQAQYAIEFQSHVKQQSNQTEDRKLSYHDPGNQQCPDNEMVIDQLRGELKQKNHEIALLQQTVHRECLERTSLLERIRGGKVKVLPEIGISTIISDSIVSSNRDDADVSNGYLEQNAKQPKASLYEKLRRAGSRKSNLKK